MVGEGKSGFGWAGRNSGATAMSRLRVSRPVKPARAAKIELIGCLESVVDSAGMLIRAVARDVVSMKAFFCHRLALAENVTGVTQRGDQAERRAGERRPAVQMPERWRWRS